MVKMGGKKKEVEGGGFRSSVVIRYSFPLRCQAIRGIPISHHGRWGMIRSKCLTKRRAEEARRVTEKGTRQTCSKGAVTKDLKKRGSGVG